MKRMLFTAAVAILGLTACGKLSEIQGKLSRSSVPTELEGSWAISCTPMSWGSYSKHTVYRGNSFHMVEVAYSDPSCQEEISRAENTGLFRLSGPVPGDSYARKIDYQFDATQTLTYDIYAVVNDMLFTGQGGGDGMSDATRLRTFGMTPLRRVR